MKTINKKIFEIILEASDGKKYSLKNLIDKFLVIYFYPGDGTSFCTIQGHKYSQLLEEFLKLKANVVGISSGSYRSKELFCNKEKFKHLLLADENFELAKGFDVYLPEGLMGYPELKIARQTYVIDKNLNIIYEDLVVDHEQDAINVLNFLKKYSA